MWTSLPWKMHGMIGPWGYGTCGIGKLRRRSQRRSVLVVSLPMLALNTFCRLPIFPDKALSSAASKGRSSIADVLDKIQTSSGPGSGSTSYKRLADVLDKIQNFSGPGSTENKLTAIEAYINSLRKDPHQVASAVKLILGQVEPDKVGVGPSIVEAAIAKLKPARHKNMTRCLKDGTADDLGTAVGMCLPINRVAKKQTLGDIVQFFGSLSKCSGTHDKTALLVSMLEKISRGEAVYLVRTLLGKGPRVGISEFLVLRALESVYSITNGWSKSRYSMDHDIDRLVEDLIQSSQTAFPYNVAQIHSPIKPMKPLAAKSVESVWAEVGRGGSWTAEWKYDGERLQIHADQHQVTIWSRNLKNVTEKYVDVQDMVSLCWRSVYAASVVIDAEVVAVKESEGRLKQLPFQELSKRKSKVTDKKSISIAVAVYAFDCLIFDGESVMQKTLEERRKCLEQAFDFSKSNRFTLVSSETISSRGSISEALSQSIIDGTEGLIVKNLSAVYTRDTRTHEWLKLKKDYLESALPDSVDAIVVGVWCGNGRNAGLFSSFLLAVRSSPGSTLQTLAKVGSGLTRVHMEEFKQSIDGQTTDVVPEDIECGKLRPDLWLKPESRTVWEVLGADLTISPTYLCAKDTIAEGKGIALRFPRLVRMRDPSEKDASCATTAGEVLALYKSQVTARQSGSLRLWLPAMLRPNHC